jgi:mono/diheme cytochrome c family protein
LTLPHRPPCGFVRLLLQYAKATQTKTDVELRKIILEGRPGTTMASFDGALDESQLTDLIAYIRSIEQ